MVQRKRNFKKRRVVRKPRNRKPKTTMTKLIRKVIQSTAEQKKVNFSASTAVCAYTATSWPTFNILPMTPFASYNNPTIGAGSGDRIGNLIRTKQCVLKYCIWPNSYTAGNNAAPVPQMIMMYLFKVKGNSNTIPANLNNFFQNGNTSNAPVGNLIDFTKQVNRDYYTPLAFRKHKLGMAAYNGTGTSAAYQGYSNNDFAFNITKSWNITKYLTKNIKYNDTTATPLSDAVFLMIQTVNADGSTQAASTIPAYMYYDINYHYTDV